MDDPDIKTTHITKVQVKTEQIYMLPINPRVSHCFLYIIAMKY
jgi:hypothetical protein